MANYSLLVTPTYTPRSFEEMVAPYAMYGEYYNSLETALSTLESGLADMEKLKNVEGAESLYNEYKTFADQLNVYSDALASGNLKGLRAKVKTAAKDYVKQIKPIEDSYNRMLETHKTYADMRIKDPTLLNSPSTNLMDYYNNPTYSWTPMSGEYLRNTMGAIAQNYQNEYDKTTQNGSFSIHHYGMTSNEIPLLIDGDVATVQKYPELYNNIQELKTQFGYDSMDQIQKKKFEEYITQGLSFGIGKDEVQATPKAASGDYSGSKNLYPVNPYPASLTSPNSFTLPEAIIPQSDQNDKILKAEKAQAEANQAQLTRDNYKLFNYYSEGSKIPKETKKQYETARKEFYGLTFNDAQEMGQYGVDKAYRNGKVQLTSGKVITKKQLEAAHMLDSKKWYAIAGLQGAILQEEQYLPVNNDVAGQAATVIPEKRVETIGDAFTYVNTKLKDAPAQKRQEKADNKWSQVNRTYNSGTFNEEGIVNMQNYDKQVAALADVRYVDPIVDPENVKILNTTLPTAIRPGNKTAKYKTDMPAGLWYKDNKNWKRVDSEEAFESYSTYSSNISFTDGFTLTGVGDEKSRTFKITGNQSLDNIQEQIDTYKEVLYGNYEAQNKQYTLPSGDTIDVTFSEDGYKVIQMGNSAPLIIDPKNVNGPVYTVQDGMIVHTGYTLSDIAKNTLLTLQQQALHILQTQNNLTESELKRQKEAEMGEIINTALNN